MESDKFAAISTKVKKGSKSIKEMKKIGAERGDFLPSCLAST